MDKIDFNGKKMNLLEARLVLLGLNLKINNLQLEGNERKEYLAWKEFRESRNKLSLAAKGYNKYSKSTERRYLIERLGEEIADYQKDRKENKNKIHSDKFHNPFASASK